MTACAQTPIHRSGRSRQPKIDKRDASLLGARVVSHGRYVTLQMAEVAVSRQMLQRT